MNNIDDKLKQFILSRWFYAIGQPIISDAEYSALLSYCKSNYADSPYVQRSWSSDPCPVELLKEIGRADAIENIILSDKTESIESLNTWEALSSKLYTWGGFGTLSYKHDGWNVQASYYNGELVQINTRGRSSDSMNVDCLRNIIPNTIPEQGRVKVVMECTIPNSNWFKVKQMFNTKSQRASVSTILSKPEYVNLLECHAFDIHGVDTMLKFDKLREWGFNTPGFVYVTCYEDILEELRNFNTQVETYNSPTDGLVFDGGFKFAIRLGAWEEPIYRSFVTGYEESYNRHVITPKLLIYPIVRGSDTQTKLAVTNWERIINLDLRVGSPVAFRVVSSSNADINEDVTQMLHEEYAGKYDVFKDEVLANEVAEKEAEANRLISYFHQEPENNMQ